MGPIRVKFLKNSSFLSLSLSHSFSFHKTPTVQPKYGNYSSDFVARGANNPDQWLINDNSSLTISMVGRFICYAEDPHR